MIIALMAALLMRLRFFLLRRGEAGRNGALRAEGEMGAAVEEAGRDKTGSRNRMSQLFSAVVWPSLNTEPFLAQVSEAKN